LLGKHDLRCRLFLLVFYFLFYFDGMHPHETASNSQSAVPAANAKHAVKHRYRFTIVKDSRNRKVRGLWRRGEKLYMQTRVSGERSARRIPLNAKTLEAAREEMADLKKKKRVEGLPDTGLRPLFSEYADKYLNFHLTASDSGKKARTIEREGHSLVHWKATIGNVRLDKITRPMIASVVKSRLSVGIKPRTVNIDVIVLRNVLNEAKEDGLIVRLPTDEITPRKVKTPVRPLLTPANFTKLCQAAAECGKNNVQVLDYVRLLAYSGARRDEALALKWEDVNFERKSLRIGADGSSKNSKARHVDLNPELEAHLKEMAQRRVPDSDWLFPSPQRGNTDKPAKTFRDSFSEARKKAKLDWVGFHDLRHYFASMAVMSGIDFKTIAEWLGHQDGGMLVGKVYGHLLPEHKQRMAERLVFNPTVIGFPALTSAGFASAVEE
jgi:integrase